MKTAWLGIMASTSLLLTGCGGDDANTAAGSTGSTGTGGQGGEGGEGGAALPIGSPCAGNNACADGFCLSEELAGYPAGYCTTPCNHFVHCPIGSTCVDIGNSNLFCLADCDPGSGGPCGNAQKCVEVDTNIGVCGPGCTTDADCAVLGKCDMSGLCVLPEDCTDGKDNDTDTLRDCEDLDCAMTCQGPIGAACMSAMPAQQMNMGDTTGKTNVFASSCTGSGAEEQIFLLTPPMDGTLAVRLDSMTDQGVYIRKTCDDPATEIACADIAFGGETEKLFVPVTAGVPLTVFVDGYISTENGPFSLNLTLMQPAGETEPNNTIAQADANGAVMGLVNGSITPMGDEDFFKVDVPGPMSTIHVMTIAAGTETCAPAGAIDTEVDIYDAVTMMPLASNDDIALGNFCSSAEAMGLAMGSYYVRARPSQAFCPDCTFSYGILIDVQ